MNCARGCENMGKLPGDQCFETRGTSSPAILCSAASPAMTEGTLVFDEPGGHQRQEKPMSEHRQALERLSALLVS